MFCLDLHSEDPFFNLAADEYFFRQGSEEYLIIGINSPAVVIGKHQSPHMEADTRFVSTNGIPVIRRISGGGTVFHDPGNINFSFILNSLPGRQVDFRKYLAPVMDFLAGLGVKVSFEGKNDLKINGLKISGNAEHVWRNRVLHHGTLLFDSDLANLGKSLRKDNSYYFSSAVKSNPSKVVNLKQFLPGIESAGILKRKMMGYFLDAFPGNSELILNSEIDREIEALAASKYRTWEWNYAYGPAYSITKKIKLQDETPTLKLAVSNGIINECSMTGSGVSAEINSALKGIRHMPEAVATALSEVLELTGDEVYKFF